jgi:hypothetical protein
VRRLGGPGAGVGFLWAVDLLETGAPKVDVARGSVVAVGGELADHDPKTKAALLRTRGPVAVFVSGRSLDNFPNESR